MLVIIFVEHTQLLESINLKMLESGPQLFLGAPWTEKTENDIFSKNRP